MMLWLYSAIVELRAAKALEGRSHKPPVEELTDEQRDGLAAEVATAEKADTSKPGQIAAPFQGVAPWWSPRETPSPRSRPSMARVPDRALLLAL
jgi:hypothetical protein